MRSLRRLLLLVPVLVLGVACQVTTVVAVQVEGDGSGHVEVRLGLDEQALARVPDLDGSGVGSQSNLAALVRTDDLAAAGWEVTGPSVDGGVTWLKATKPFGTADEANAVLAELTGPEGPLGSLQLARETSFGVTRYSFTGTADLSEGLEAFGDEGLAEVLDGETLGESPEDLEVRFGRLLEEMFHLRMRAQLPGDVDEEWSLALGGEPVAVEATSTVYNVPALALASVAGLCAVVLAGLVIARLVRR